MAQQTAVDWLYNDLFPKKLDGFSIEEWSKIDKAFEQAKEMEKQQIEDAYKKGHNFMGNEFNPKQYYNKTYGNEK